MGWDKDGLVTGRIVGFDYNEPSKTLIVHGKRETGPKREASDIFTRRLDETQYTKVFGPDDLTFVRSVASVSKAPLVFLDVCSHGVGPHAGSNWSRVERLDLLTGELTTALDAESFRQRHRGADDPSGVPCVSVSDLHSASDDGTVLLCTIAKPRPDPKPDSPGFIHIDRFLCRLDLSTGDFERLTLLRNTFF